MTFDLYFWFVALSAVFLVGLAKSGLIGALGVVGVPLLTLVMTPREAAGVLLPLLLVMDVFAVYAHRRDVNWKVLKIFLPGAFVGIGIGWALFSVVSDSAVLLLIGSISFIFILDSFLPLRKKLEGLPPSNAWGRFWGMLSGFTSFVAHSGGPPWQVWVLPQRLEPRAYAASAAWGFAILNTIKLVPYGMLGQLSTNNLSLSAKLAPAAVVGVLLGIFLVRRISVKLFYRIAYVLVFLLSIKLIYDGASGLLAG